MTSLIPPPVPPERRERLAAAYGLDLVDLARARVTVVDPTSTLDAVVRRLFDRDQRDRYTVSAFGASL